MAVLISASQGCPANGMCSSLCPVPSLHGRIIEVKVELAYHCEYTDIVGLSVELVLSAPGTCLSCI